MGMEKQRRDGTRGKGRMGMEKHWKEMGEGKNGDGEAEERDWTRVKGRMGNGEAEERDGTRVKGRMGMEK